MRYLFCNIFTTVLNASFLIPFSGNVHYLFLYDWSSYCTIVEASPFFFPPSKVDEECDILSIPLSFQRHGYCGCEQNEESERRT